MSASEYDLPPSMLRHYTNRVILCGHLKCDPVIKKVFGQGRNKERASFALVTVDSWLDKQTKDMKHHRDVHNVVVFVPKVLNMMRECNISRNDFVYIVGSLHTRQWKGGASAENNSTIDESMVRKKQPRDFVTEVILQDSASLMLLVHKGNGKKCNYSQSDSNLDEDMKRYDDENNKNVDIFGEMDEEYSSNSGSFE